MVHLSTQYYSSPVGFLEVKADETGICSVLFKDQKDEKESPSSLTNTCVKQLAEYFEGSRKKFELPLAPEGTPFQQKVWNELNKIPYGHTCTYLQMAVALGDAKCIRAAGTANGKNPIAIIIPCHRVIGANGKLTGYAGGLWRKEWLLDQEAKISGTFTKLF